MTRDDIIRMAETAVRAIAPPEYADCPVDKALLKEWFPMLDRFAAFVAAHEREACAKLCEQKSAIRGGEIFAARIRARGQQI